MSAVFPPEHYDALARFSKKQIASAGPRYSPGVDPAAPNIPSEELVEIVASLTCGPETRERLDAFTQSLRDALQKHGHASANSASLEAHVAQLTSACAGIADRLITKHADVLTDLKAKVSALADTVRTELDALYAAERNIASAESDAAPQNKPPDQERQRQLWAIRAKQSDVRHLQDPIASFSDFLGSPAGEALVNNLALLRGVWGTGKTHFLCDITRTRLDAGRPTLLFLAKNMGASRHSLSTIAEPVAGATTDAELVCLLDRLGQERNERSLLVIDGANEGPRAACQEAIARLIALVSLRTHVALVISCRTPFEELLLNEKDRAALVTVSHRGFAEQEFDAQAEFFSFYGLPLPEVPLLEEEFSRPLTLKLICEAFQHLSSTKMAKGFTGLASGQRGMTFVLETFVNRVGSNIEDTFRLKHRSCWILLKGSNKIIDARRAGFADYMAATGREYVPRRSALRIIASHFPGLTSSARAQLLDALRTNGLVDEDVIWRGPDKPASIIFRLPYQRFSDHLVARCLLERYLNHKGTLKLRESFSVQRPLGKVFRVRRHGVGYANPGWAQALITEFPERAKRSTTSRERELYYFLPKASQRIAHYFEPFIAGLYWRSRSSFSTATTRVLNEILRHATERGWMTVLDALVALSIRKSHPFRANWLYRCLATFPMAERDVIWGEFLRLRYNSPSVRRLLRWLESVPIEKIDERTGSTLITLLSLLLTTVVRHDRDAVTRRLVQIGERYPSALFRHCLLTLSFNDPYVRERMLAAAYGVSLSLVARPKSSAFRRALLMFAKSVYGAMFSPTSPHATHHVLCRDYALGIICIARRLRRSLLSRSESNCLRPPFKYIASPFRDSSALTAEIGENGTRAIHTDFGNYTMGRLIPDRSNYDFDHPTYKMVRAQIDLRIHDLGYQWKTFENIDRDIGNRSSYEESHEKERRTDRYGKKYSWIAYFEMYGYRQAKGLLSDYREDERCTDADIDPSFPKEPPPWSPPIPDLYGDTAIATEAWVAGGVAPDFAPLLRVHEINGVAGPWVLLDGHVRGDNQEIDRNVFAFLRGVFVASRDVDRLRKAFLAVEFPGNREIPDFPQAAYSYAGELMTGIGYSSMPVENISRPRQIGEAFVRYVGRRHAPPPVVVTTDENDPEGTFVLRIPADRYRPRRVSGVSVELPTRSYGWESYHSAENQFTGFALPSAKMIHDLGLRSWNGEIDFRDPQGQPASVYRFLGTGWNKDAFEMLYLREDLLKTYLARTRQCLVWCNWGERDWSHADGAERLRTKPNRHAILAKHDEIHRRFVEYRRLT